MLAVAKVTVNRSKANFGGYRGICATVYAPKQFSWTFNPKVNRKLKNLTASEQTQYTLAREIAEVVLQDKFKAMHSNVLWYHTGAVKPIWRNNLKVYSRIGSHIFYQPKP